MEEKYMSFKAPIMPRIMKKCFFFQQNFVIKDFMAERTLQTTLINQFLMPPSK
jgi:hypothetical protein